ncbi:MAG: hypothetical protein KC422_18945 [Trueperaceae bacterium]|nr:hypothetical protein [Trueperaceae bacterium]
MPETRSEPSSLLPLLCLLAATFLLVPLGRNVLFLPLAVRLSLGLLASLGFVYFLQKEAPDRRLKYLALAIPLAILALAPIDTGLGFAHILTLVIIFSAVLVIPYLLLEGKNIISYKLFPERLDPLDLIYTLVSIPLAWGALTLYLKIMSPEVPYNWVLSPEPEGLELFKLFMGINGVGIWDELFFVNTSYAILRSLFPYRTANLAQSVIYMSILYDMAFSGWGPLFVYILALTQGAMYERSKALIWVLLVHLIVDYFLFQIIVSTYYPDLSVWWHP